MATQTIDRDRIQRAFNEFETRKSLLHDCTELWKNLSTHLSSLEDSLLQKSKALDTKIETLDSDTSKSLQAIEQRENSISERESKAVARVEEQKQAALSEFEKMGTSSDLELSEALKSYCRKMDSSGLLKFMVTKRKESTTLRAKINDAIAESVDPHCLILDAMEDFLLGKTAKVGVSDRRWACGTLIQALLPVEELSVKAGTSIARTIAERAGSIVEAWKVKIDEREGIDMGGAEAAMFLQMVVGFGLRSRFDDGFLRKLVLEFSSRRDIPKLAATLGFGDKMEDIIDELVKSGKEIDAIYFAYESGLTERFSPVPLLRTYLRNKRKTANTVLKNGNYNATATEAASALELNSLKAIIKCVEDHKLESDFTLDSLRKRATQLEKTRVDKRKSTFVGSRPQNNRARGGGGGGGGGSSSSSVAFRPAKAGRVSNPYPSYGRRNTAPRMPQHPAAGYTAPYNYPSQPIYEGSPSTSYTPSYGGPHARSPAAPPQHYSYKPEDMAVGGAARASTSYPAQPNYGASYDYSPGAPATYQPSYPQ